MLTIKQIISLITTYETEIIIVVTAIMFFFLIIKRHLWLLLFLSIFTSIVFIDQLAMFAEKFYQLFR